MSDTPSGDVRRVLQLLLAVVWVLDGLLQFQPFMYTTAFGKLLAATAAGNPGFIARPITWDATLVNHHLALVNTLFATIQLLLGLGIAFRPTVRLALGASIVWALSVWWLGEGLGGVLNGTANPFTGAPGAVIIYALLAVVLWPVGHDLAGRHSGGRRTGTRTFAAARAVGAPVARLLWAVLWLSLAYFALLPANRAPQAMHDAIAGMVSGDPAWLAAVERNAASLVAQQGLAASIAFAVAFVAIAVGVFLPRPYARAAVLLALVVSAVIWVVGEAFGMILIGGATDPNSGLLLALLALSFWPPRSAVPAEPQEPKDQAEPTMLPAAETARTAALEGNLA
jgi:hypothetical protein